VKDDLCNRAGQRFGRISREVHHQSRRPVLEAAVRVLVIEDETRLARGLRNGLEAESFEVEVAADGGEGLALARAGGYDVVVLDIMLPTISGHQVCRTLRAEGDWTPILMLTARDDERDEVQALNAGADDYLTKPFSYAVLLARLRALLRRGARERPALLTVGDLSLDPLSRTVIRGGVEVSLTARELSVLECLLRRPGEVVPKGQILEYVWDDDFDGDPNIVEVYVRHLRNKLDRPFDRHTIETLRGVGYRVVADLSAPPVP
jgi:two-component system, OmpR family, response regulator